MALRVSKLPFPQVLGKKNLTSKRLRCQAERGHGRHILPCRQSKPSCWVLFLERPLPMSGHIAGKTFQNLTTENGILRARDWWLWRRQPSRPEDRKWKDTFVSFKVLPPKSCVLSQVFPGKAPSPAPPGPPVSIHNYFPQLSAEMAPVKP